jgi:hypothetical protein
VIVQEREAAMAELQALKKRNDLLTVRAPLDGIVTADAPVPQVGQWVGLGDPLFHIVDGTGGVLTGFVVERDSRRIANGAQVVFVPEDASQPSVMAHVNGVGMPGGEGLALNYLRAATGGAVATAAKDTGQKSEGAAGYLPVAMTAEGPAPAFAVAGTAHAAATPRSFASFVFGRFITVALRESGF